MSRLLACLLALALLVAAAPVLAEEGCPSCVAAAAVGTGEVAAASPAPAGGTVPAAAPAPAGSDAPVPEPVKIEGKIVETMDGGGYTYVQVETPDGKKIWAAGPPTKLAAGDAIAFTAGMKMIKFQSKALSREFEELYFSDALGGTVPADAAAGMPAGHPPVAGMPAGHPQVAAVAAEKIEGIAKADKTVEEIYAGKADLAGQIVSVRGKVVKVNRGILGRNWIHLQDGSGAAGTNDLTVTTQGEAAKGDVVLAAGVLAVDKDFGSGYRYDALLEEASVTVETPAPAEKKEEAPSKDGTPGKN